MKVFLHVGLQKTGTTYLQTRVFPQISEITYIGRPYTQENHAFNTLQYADGTLYEPERLEHEITAIRRASEGRSAVVISDELLSGFPFYNYLNRELIARRLAAVLPDAEVIIFLRNQVELILSLYNQYVKINWYSNILDDRFMSAPGSGAALEDWLANRLEWQQRNRYIWNRAKFNVEHFRYSRLLDLYKQIFARVHVFLYEDFRHNSADVLRSLSEVLGVEMPILAGPAMDNPSLSDSELHRRRIVNQLSRISSRFNSPMGNVLGRALAPVLRNHAASNRAHVESLLRAADIAADNRAVDSRWNCGMSQHARLYFSDHP
jgi:hypothetical protein